MKYMNHVKSGLLAMAFACAGTVSYTHLTLPTN